MNSLSMIAKSAIVGGWTPGTDTQISGIANYNCPEYLVVDDKDEFVRVTVKVSLRGAVSSAKQPTLDASGALPSTNQLGSADSDKAGSVLRWVQEK